MFAGSRVVSRVVFVSSTDTLTTALQTAQAGDRIELAGGVYGQLTLKQKANFNVDFPDGVVIASADPADPAVFAGIDLRDVQNLTFGGVTFDYTYAVGDPVWLRPFMVQDSTNVHFHDVTFAGDTPQGVSVEADGFGTGIGLSVRSSTDISVTDSVFTSFHRGLVISDSGDITLTGNEITDMRSDGMNFSAVTDLLVEGNHIHDFRTSAQAKDHPDFIQIWTNGTDTPSTGITIRGNLLDIGQGAATQSIFIRNDVVDRGLAGDEMFFQDITITDNTIINAQTHGITVGETDGLVIANNTVLHSDGDTPDGADSSVEIPRIHVSGDARDVTVTLNVVAAVHGDDGQSDWSVTDNILVQDQDPQAAGFYGDVFVSSTGDGGTFVPVSGGGIETLGAGATAAFGTSDGTSGTTPIAQFQVSPDADNTATRIFDAGASTGANSYHWDFGDGTTATGLTASHTYTDGGTYTATLTAVGASGVAVAAVAPVTVQGPDVLIMQAFGDFVAFDAGEAVALDGPDQGDAQGLLLGDPGVLTSIDRTHVRDILTSDDVEITGTLSATSADGAGEVFRLHGSILVEVTPAGELSVRAWDTDGAGVRVVTSGAGLLDQQPHDFEITLQDGQLSVAVDGVGTATAFNGTLQDKGRLDFMIGNPWSKANFEGGLRDFAIRVNADDFADADPDSFVFENHPSMTAFEHMMFGADQSFDDLDTRYAVQISELIQDTLTSFDLSDTDSLL